MKCNNCGLDNPSDAKFCRGCGEKFSTNSFKWLIIGVCALLAVFIIVSVVNNGDRSYVVNNDNSL